MISKCQEVFAVSRWSILWLARRIGKLELGNVLTVHSENSLETLTAYLSCRNWVGHVPNLVLVCPKRKHHYLLYLRGRIIDSNIKLNTVLPCGNGIWPVYFWSHSLLMWIIVRKIVNKNWNTAVSSYNSPFFLVTLFGLATLNFQMFHLTVY